MAGANPEALGGILPLQAGSPSAQVAPGVNIGDVLYWNGAIWVPLAPGLDGFQLTTHGIGIAPTWTVGTAAPPLLGFGANNLTATTTTRYLFPWFSDGQAETAPTQYRLTRAGTLRNFRLRHNIPAGNGQNIVYTVRINGVPTALTITLASTGTDGADLVNSVVVVAGDLIDIVATKALGIGASPINIEGSLEYAA